LGKTPENVLKYPYITVSTEELAEFKSLIAARPGEFKNGKAYFWIAQDAYNHSEWDNADKTYSELLRRFPHSEWAGVARLMQARTRAKLKNANSALALLYPMVKPSPKANPDLKAAALAVGRDIINDELTLADLGKVRTAYPDTPWAAQALFAMGKRTLDAGSPDQAIKLFKQFMETYPQHEYAAGAQELIEKAKHLAPINRYKLGCMLPLSGPYAPYGKAIKQGLELAVQQVNIRRPEGEQITLVMADSESNTSVVLRELHRLVEEEKVMAVIGPALSVSVKAVLPEINSLRIPVISPAASEPGLTRQSAYFFRYLLTNEQQGEAMAEYLVLRQGMRRVSVLHSENRYDRSLADAFVKKVEQLGGQVVTNVEYAAGTTDFKDSMMALGGVDPGPLKNRELEERKSMDRLLETWSQQIADQLAPEAQKVTLAQAALATPVADKRVAIVRFSEYGTLTQQEQMGKKVSERFSYALAGKAGLEVLTQRQTFDTLRKLQLSPLAFGREGAKKFGEAMNVGYVVVGSVDQREEDDRVPLPGRALPVHYNISVRVLNARSGQEVFNAAQTWVKMIAPEANVRNVEALYLPVALEDAVSIVPQLAFYDLSMKVYGPDAWISPRLFREGVEILNGVVLATGFWVDNPEPGSHAFVKQFIDAYTAPPSTLSAQAFDTLQLVAKVCGQLPRDSVSREDLVSALLKETEFNGVTGKAWVESDGEIRREPFFLKFDQGILKKEE
jgi:ABC-type branched-subunit amino acid transport system substrate-binding protein